ncbi:MAG: helix-turn-helix transcriptional regulator, partial [Desulfovibrio fairfieldensis]|nr:helix-turn-helix transcriptional regulator [Desulfovibrio fairfieldensis]
MTLEELGAALRAEREKRGLSIEDVANHLKIGARLLRALEEGDASSLPHLAYAKGFIRSYSSYLGMAAEEVNEAVCALGGTSPAVPQPVYTPEESLAPGRSLKWLGV